MENALNSLKIASSGRRWRPAGSHCCRCSTMEETMELHEKRRIRGRRRKKKKG
jgi:hypothetical protein